MFKPRPEDILNLLNQKKSLYVGWTKEDEMRFIEETIRIRDELYGIFLN